MSIEIDELLLSSPLLIRLPLILSKASFKRLLIVSDIIQLPSYPAYFHISMSRSIKEINIVKCF